MNSYGNLKQEQTAQAGHWCTMEDNNCSSEKKRAASKAFGPTAEDDDSKKKEEEEKVQSQCAKSDDCDGMFAETATAPTVEECVSFIERNQAMRQIIGLLIELEEGQDGDKEMVVDESNNDNDSASPGGNETDSCYVYDDSEDWVHTSPGNDTESCYGYDPSEEPVILYESHYEYFRRKQPHVSWRDLARAADGDDDDDLNKTHFGLEEESSDCDNEYDKDDVVEAASQSDFPTLQELVLMKVSAQFQKDSKLNERKHTSFLASLLRQTKSNVKDVYSHQQKQLKASPELAVVCLLESLLAIAKDKLDVRTEWHHHSANSRGSKIIQDATKHRAEIRRNWFSERQSILDAHSSFLEQHAPRDLDGDGNVQTKFVLCSFPDCRNLFTPHLVPENKRCIVPDCMSTRPICGCSTKPCSTCRGPVCKDHFKKDAHDCAARARRTCGYFSDEYWTSGVNGLYCNRAFDNPVIGQCTRCHTMCCSDCLTFCMICNLADCKVCLDNGGRHMCGYN